MSYETIKPDWYRIHQPDGPYHAGATGWSQAPWPGWGENPNLIGPRMLAVNGFGDDMLLPGEKPHAQIPIPPAPVTTVMKISPVPPPTTTASSPPSAIPWTLIGLAGLVAVGGYFMLKKSSHSGHKANGPLRAFRRNGGKRRQRPHEGAPRPYKIYRGVKYVVRKSGASYGFSVDGEAERWSYESLPEAHRAARSVIDAMKGD